jgi:ubiquinone biosynthesis protein COQ4
MEEIPMATASPPTTTNRMQPLRALRLLIEILRDPDATNKVFEFFRAIGGDDGPAHFREFLCDPAGRALLAQRPSLLGALADEPYLAALPEGSLGRAYLAAMRARGFSPAQLLAYREQTTRDLAPEPADEEWFYQRINVMHDLWHVLTGYGTDPLGEAALIAFSEAQIPNRSFPLLLLGALLKGPKSWDLAWPRYLWRAFQRGRHAQLLTAAPFEALLALPLEQVREQVGVGSAASWHPGGIWRGELSAPQPLGAHGAGGSVA